MKKILAFALCCIVYAAASDAAVRDGNAKNRANSATVTPVVQRITTTERTAQRTTSRLAAPARNATSQRTTATTSRNATTRAASTTQTVSPRAATTNTTRGANVSPRAASSTTTVDLTETRTGAAYEQCKNAYFACMDQFCQLKNDDYRRCSCSDRVLELAEIRDVMQDAGNQLTVFNENLDTVGMTAEQATAMKTASEGENALTSDKSASKALLQAIMNSIRGEDSTVGGKFTDLNSINISFNTANAFGTLDAGAAIAAYNGKNLYTAVYPQCRNAVRADCNDASLQRAINAYLMAIEQDCNTVQTAIETTQKQMKSAVRESSAMLDLARVENRRKHNSDDITTCVNNVESAILSEEVCGANYHKCLDNGEFIDISTGAPIAGVEKFYELENLLKFADGVGASEQQLSKVKSNRAFVQNFEKRTKKFAQPALDKCTEQADVVWAEYLDKALLSIYYAQKSKVAEIKQGCFDFVSTCYMNGEAGLTAAMKELAGDNSIVLQPDKVTLTKTMCSNYINSCNYMFDGDIIAKYIENRQETDTLTACRAVAKQCFDKFGGTGYENFYYPYSGLFTTGKALDWFTLYEYTLGDDANAKPIRSEKPVSECARQLQEIESCSSPEMLAKAFGGFDVIKAKKGKTNAVITYYLISDADAEADAKNTYRRYGSLELKPTDAITTIGGEKLKGKYPLYHHQPRTTGVATEMYNQIVDILTTQCTNLQGRFVELQSVKDGAYDENNICLATFANYSAYKNLVDYYGIADTENMCPRDYSLAVDTQSWGACQCWENGGRRSKFGTSAKCAPVLPLDVPKDKLDVVTDDILCNATSVADNATLNTATKESVWCLQSGTPAGMSVKNQVCSMESKKLDDDGNCGGLEKDLLKNLPEGITN